MNGSDFIKMIRDINHEIPIIILSIDISNKVLCDSINYGIQGYLQKPINGTLLLEKINNVKNEIHQKYLTKEYQNITNSSAIISKVNTEGIITYVNEVFCSISGYKKEELIGQSYSILRVQEKSSLFYTILWDKIKNKKEIWNGILKQRNKEEELYYLKTTIQPIIDQNEEIIEFISLSVLVTEMVHPQDQLNDYLKQQKDSILFLIKIEEFKYLEHSFTEKITKKLQQLFANELLRHMPEECGFSKIYLLNKGEFAFVQKYNEDLDEKYIIQTLKRFQRKVNQEKIKIGIVDYSLSIICSLAYGEDSLMNAKIGLKKIFKSKKNFIVANNFLEELTRDANAKLNKFIMLKTAIDSYNIVSHFQPIVNNKTRKIEKYESLVRLIDTENNIVSPYHFLEIAKEGQYYHTITSIVLQNSFQALFYINIDISINLSALDLQDESTRDYFILLLNKYKTEAHRITIELVEDESIQDKQDIQKFIQEVKNYGVKIALDDFGKGFSNFARIQAYQPNYIKIDGSLIRNIEQDSLSRDLVETIVFFAKKQKIKTIAEYVENENIYKILLELGIDYSQGHYFGKAGLLKEFNLR
ncbi:MAG: diguanylate cyclase/phosphodiesterase (GGDEF & EAL domains) with PAS/PAC sensor(s) [uncultured Sulfurovum sp.]|uniref:Diguanylate cyclase/phosphodiesterase (GGDEF & EAL domains) with PAS/PAC sensor(S) n=1 Tax=uncultured Sulfurovum sp. TaxID=269237 RepID=A0A6S6TEX0_9BACT|nr:MAG: diguanylate cyclase/phosphodiesterase (GGDEF & EAL domains) with PAS/PAC sensor(s) [uncultured Sulfurovum sp.]